MFVHHIAYTLKVLFFSRRTSKWDIFMTSNLKKAKVSCFFFKMTIFWFKFEIIEGAKKKIVIMTVGKA